MSIDICNELKQNFIDFSYEANSQRAFPDARDGLKPGQRACLWEFYTKGYLSSKPHVKSAKVAGGVIASWWPHGDSAIYETFARMSQNWINNIPEVDWHGSNGNIVIGSVPASSRYTEARLAPAIEEGMFRGIKKKNVPMILNFSEDEKWPEVLPAIFPRLMVNGSQGIGVSVAQTWVPHNLIELTEVINNYVTTGTINYNNLAPDFPSGGIIVNKDELPGIYATGKGKIVLRATTSIEKNTIKITELPYQVYVEPLLEEIKDLIQKETLSGINEVYNKTDKKRLLIEIECTEAPFTVLNKLFRLTSLEKTYSPNQMALVSKTPKLLNLQKYLNLYITHNIECLIKEYQFDLEQAEARKEIVDGLLIALVHIDDIIRLIKQADSAAAARADLIRVYNFTENQAKAIVDMKLGRLARLEWVELEQEKAQLELDIQNYTAFLTNPKMQEEEFLARLNNFTKKFGKERKTQVTQIASSKEEKEIEMVEPEQCVVIMTESGLIKRVPVSVFKVQKRAGRGVKTQDDIVNATIRTNTIDSLLIFGDKGNMYRLLVNEIPEGNNASKGVSVKSLVNMEIDEWPATIYSLYRNTEAKYVLFVTKKGMVKKTALEEYSKTKKKSGLAALVLNDGDELASVSLINNEDIVIITEKGMSIRTRSKDFNPMGRIARGVKGITLSADDRVVTALPWRNAEDDLAIFSQSGLGKRVKGKEFSVQGRGGKGNICYKPTKATGLVSAATFVTDDDIILISGDRASICISASDIPVHGRPSIGVLLIKNDNVTSVSKVK